MNYEPNDSNLNFSTSMTFWKKCKLERNLGKGRICLSRTCNVCLCLCNLSHSVFCLCPPGICSGPYCGIFGRAINQGKGKTLNRNWKVFLFQSIEASWQPFLWFILIRKRKSEKKQNKKNTNKLLSSGKLTIPMPLPVKHAVLLLHCTDMTDFYRFPILNSDSENSKHACKSSLKWWFD